MIFLWSLHTQKGKKKKIQVERNVNRIKDIEIGKVKC